MSLATLKVHKVSQQTNGDTKRGSKAITSLQSNTFYPLTCSFSFPPPPDTGSTANAIVSCEVSTSDALQAI